jgi:hypothetical protein
MARHGRSWWPEQEITVANIAAAIEHGPVDVLVIYDAPSGVQVPGATGYG